MTLTRHRSSLSSSTGAQKPRILDSTVVRQQSGHDMMIATVSSQHEQPDGGFISPAYYGRNGVPSNSPSLPPFPLLQLLWHRTFPWYGV